MSVTLEAVDLSQRQRLAVQIEAVNRRLERKPKLLSWRVRARLGERVKWYRDVDEVR